MQNHILNGTVLLDQCQSFLRTQTRYLVTVVTTQQNAEVDKLKDYRKVFLCQNSIEIDLGYLVMLL